MKLMTHLDGAKMDITPEQNKYRDIVESYVQNRLPEDGLHSSFQHLSDVPTIDTRRSPPAYSQTNPDLPKLVIQGDGESESGEEDDVQTAM